jgi:hypothetical protein
VGLGALPSFIFTGRGGADSGSTYFGLLGDIDAGARFKILKRVQLDVGVMQTIGSVNGSGAQGFGVNGGLRIEQ